MPRWFIRYQLSSEIFIDYAAAAAAGAGAAETQKFAPTFITLRPAHLHHLVLLQVPWVLTKGNLSISLYNSAV